MEKKGHDLSRVRGKECSGEAFVTEGELRGKPSAKGFPAAARQGEA